jgi:putative ABC transport system ATP-binding protein
MRSNGDDGSVRDGPDAGAQDVRDAPVGDVRLDRVTKVYERGGSDVHALTDVTLHFGAGEFVVLLGPSGSGKTTMLNIIGGIEPASAGVVTVSGRTVGALDGRALDAYRRDEVGFVFQFFNLVPSLTAAENVEVIAELSGSDAIGRSEAALERVGLAAKTDHFPGQLSGGEQQRVAIARALAKGTPVLLADEPTGSLDLDTGRQILELLRATAERGTTVVLVTHNSAIAEMADRVVHLSDGRVASDVRVDDPIDADEVTW